MGLIICSAKCWPCTLDEHFDPPQVHTWMDAEDAEAAGLKWPLSAEDADKNRCPCFCGEGPGGCRFIPGQQELPVQEEAA